MRLFFICICYALTIGAYAQTTVNKSYLVQPGQKINLKFDYPIVKVSTWEKNEVAVAAHVNINDHENDSSFVIKEEMVNGAMVISDYIKDFDKLPRRYTIVRNGQKIIFRSKDEYQRVAKNSGVEYSTEGSDINIVVEIKIPVQSFTDIKSVYGIVELANFHAPVTIDATYGGIDATINSAQVGKLQATTSYGHIYSNLELKLTDHTERDFFNSLTAEPGKGPAYSFTSTYGKIYLRKP
ncbi:hypothetical protein [uncultured Mucilaginibacter sp.]|uniref:hypothetical protein n=1 Tax=uncultured Mucilaginibacter sp. TaxID=797541 RepID=UPI002607DB75|nr:hypothetical protein [uncultured Mucilaginibacter sp.]